MRRSVARRRCRFSNLYLDRRQAREALDHQAILAWAGQLEAPEQEVVKMVSLADRLLTKALVSTGNGKVAAALGLSFQLVR